MAKDTFTCEQGHQFIAEPKLTDRHVACPACGSSVWLGLTGGTVVHTHRDTTKIDGPDPLIGKTIAGGRYLIESFIRAGGMGRVYRAKQCDMLGRSVAVKVLQPTIAGDHSSVDRFIREAMTISGLSHPNVIKVELCDREGDLCFLVMELVLGPTSNPTTLTTIIEDLKGTGRLSIEDIGRYAGELLDALDYIHREGVVHRDVKPSNVLVDRWGRLKLSDFGLATGAVSQGAKTVAGTMMGTLSYMSPEQARGDSKLDFRTDLYAAGCLIYDLLLGSQHQNRMTPVSSRRDELTSDVDAVLLRATDPDPGRRFQSAAMFKHALLSAFQNATLPLPSPPLAEPPTAISNVSFEETISGPPKQIVVDMPAPALPNPPAKPRKKRKGRREGILVLGRSNAGKTLFVTALYKQFGGASGKPGRGDVQLMPVDRATVDYLTDKMNALGDRRWPAANSTTQVLEFDVVHPEGRMKLVTVDPKGETLERAFDEVHQSDPEVKELLAQIDRAAGLIFLSDPRNMGSKPSSDDWFFSKVIARICGEDAKAPIPIPLALVLTKFDVNAPYIAKLGGLHQFCLRKFPYLVLRAPDLRVFAASVIGQTTTPDGRSVPSPQKILGVAEPFLHVLDGAKPRRIDRLKIVFGLIIVVATIAAAFVCYGEWKRAKPASNPPATSEVTSEAEAP